MTTQYSSSNSKETITIRKLQKIILVMIGVQIAVAMVGVLLK